MIVGSQRLDRHLLVPLVPLMILLVGAWSHRWVAEDAFINIRIVHQTLAGHPFSFNASERVEAGTSPLWVAMLTVLQALLGWAVDLAWLALLAGLALTLVGLAAAMAGATMLARRQVQTGLLLPAGALVLAVLPPMWDFATSGLETGLTFGWLGVCFWGLCRSGTHLRGDRLVGESTTPGASPAGVGPPAWLAAFIGLGILIRPDLGLFTMAFIGVYLWMSAPGWSGRLRTLVLAAALPAAFQVFRMAYFAALVPNTALAKEASRARWSSGIRYAVDFAGPYVLLLPVLLLGAWAACVYGSRRDPNVGRDRIVLVLVAAPVVASVLHATYVVFVGGDFMHARLLLPATFGLLMPVAMLPIPDGGARRLLAGGAAVSLVGWTVACGLTLRLPYSGTTIEDGIADERGYWDALSGRGNAVTLEDHAGYAGIERGRMARRLAEQHADVLILGDGTQIRLAPGRGVVLETVHIGLVSAAAGTDVQIYDSFGLADPIGSRLLTVTGTDRVGHEKQIPTPWIIARSSPDDPPDRVARNATNPIDIGQVDAAQRSLRCPRIARLLQATSADITPGRLLANIVHANELTRLRFPAEPELAATCASLD